jgi:hypothetical protein
MQTLVRIDGNVQWQTLRGRGGNWVAACQPLKITLQAETWAGLMETIAEALDALLKDLLTSHELDSFLREHGWAFVGQVQIPQHVENVRFDVPFFLAMTAQPNDSQRNICQ